MRTPTFALLVATLSLVMPSHARADNTAAARRAIQAAYDKMNSAMARKDANGAMAFITDDYTETSAGPPVHGRAEKLAQARQIIAACKSLRAKSTIDKITLAGRSASVIVSEEGQLVLVSPQDHAAHHIVITDRDKDTWVRTGKGWKISRSDEMQSKAYEDGKLVRHNP